MYNTSGSCGNCRLNRRRSSWRDSICCSVVAQRTPSRLTLFCSSLSVMWAADFASTGNASVQRPLSARVAARSAAAGVTAAAGLLETCAEDERLMAGTRKISEDHLVGLRIMGQEQTHRNVLQAE